MGAGAVPYEKLKKIRACLFDVDGVLTDGRILLGEGPEGALHEHKAFHARDGQGLILASDAGLEVGLVTSRASAIVERRARELRIGHVFQNVKDKLQCVRGFLSGRGLRFEQLLYMGDDLPDLPVLDRAGFSATVPEAPREIRAGADYVTDLPGGSGAVREVLDLLFRTQGRWPKILKKYRK
ncbi:MAG: hypothetical protein A3G34_05510 [Candidatus Lindowbacteria bacterium RIFCSPLOWO2_12_FULL_62_27]|nr:MAG: hypothetical protein A3G34_05510 [Candidatus Lindowbacteria bacterium RIFCSPLOWO2_12_FULL_62_27]OGH63766.1 MAG: hypothetical protein A3I06_10755 [Candidatus Lindowbacteria bacterium RIFCSPLOWO2_02_FULL_62_12]